MIGSGTKFNRYTLLEVVSEHEPRVEGEFVVQLWLGQDEILDRNVAIRLVRTEDRRVPKVLGAAQAAAVVDDRRLLRVLDPQRPQEPQPQARARQAVLQDELPRPR